MSRSVFVVGVHRSGTSLVAGILDHLGIDMGQHELEKTQEGDPLGNKYGNYEDLEFARRLRRMMGNWRHPRQHNYRPEYIDAICGLVEKRDAEKPLWGVKNPKFCFCVEPFIAAAEDPIVIFTSRSLEASTHSLFRRSEGRLPFRICKHIIDEYWLGRFIRSRNINDDLEAPLAIVDYDDLVDKPEALVPQLAHFALQGTDAEPDLEAAIDFVDPDVRHF